MTHEEAWDLIPWLVNDSIEPAQRAYLEQHLDGCMRCHGELKAQRVLLQAMNAGPQVEAMPRASLQKLWARLDADATPAAVRKTPALRQRLTSFSWMLASAACLVLLLGASVLALLRSAEPPAAAYRTVADPAMPAGSGIRAVFAGDLQLAELQGLLEITGLSIVAGPTASGVYTLDAAASGADSRAALAMLRAHPAVRFAEPAGP